MAKTAVWTKNADFEAQTVILTTKRAFYRIGDLGVGQGAPGIRSYEESALAVQC